MAVTKKTFPFDQEVERIIGQDTRQKCDVLLYGSSTFTHWGLKAQEALKPLTVINHGFGGSNAEAADYYFDKLVAPIEFSTLILYEGDNDLTQDYIVEDVIFYFKRILAKVQNLKRKVKVIILEVKPTPARLNLLEKQKKLNRKLHELTTIFSNTYFLPMQDVVYLSPGKFRPGIFVEDDLHFSPLGYKFLSAAISGLLEKLYPDVVFAKKRAFDGTLWFIPLTIAVILLAVILLGLING